MRNNYCSYLVLFNNYDSIQKLIKILQAITFNTNVSMQLKINSLGAMDPQLHKQCENLRKFAKRATANLASERKIKFCISEEEMPGAVELFPPKLQTCSRYTSNLSHPVHGRIVDIIDNEKLVPRRRPHYCRLGFLKLTAEISDRNRLARECFGGFTALKICRHNEH